MSNKNSAKETKVKLSLCGVTFVKYKNEGDVYLAHDTYLN